MRLARLSRVAARAVVATIHTRGAGGARRVASPGRVDLRDVGATPPPCRGTPDCLDGFLVAEPPVPAVSGRLRREGDDAVARTRSGQKEPGAWPPDDATVPGTANVSALTVSQLAQTRRGRQHGVHALRPLLSRRRARLPPVLLQHGASWSRPDQDRTTALSLKL